MRYKWEKVLFGIACFLSFVFISGNAMPKYPNEYCPDVYNSSKHCLLRSGSLNRIYWNHYAGLLCYNYTNSARFVNKYQYDLAFNFTCKNVTILLPVALVDNNTIALFDYNHAESAELLKKSFSTDELYENYIKCCSDAVDCCDNEMTNENIVSTSTQCPVIWDGWSCFPQTQVNTTQTLPCSSQAYQSPDKVCTLKSKKDCLWNSNISQAIWNQQTDYTGCAIAPVYLKRYNYHVTALLVCTVCCMPAIIIFLAIPVFRDTLRVVLHRNLLIAIVVRNVLTIMAKKLVIIDALLSTDLSHHVMENNSVACRVLAFFVGAATNATFACMLMDGYYLHKVIVRTFAKNPQLITIYGVTAVLTLLPSIIWVSVVASHHRESCWMVDTNGEQWSVDSFRVVILVINTLLLMDIIRVMLFKMKQKGPTKQTKVAFRATLFLIPLFGLHIFITAKKIVINDTCLAEDVYDYFRYTMEASQGICVALFFCYANSEVHYEVGNAIRKTTIHLNQKFGWNIKWKSTSNRRTTTASYLEPQSK